MICAFHNDPGLCHDGARYRGCSSEPFSAEGVARQTEFLQELLLLLSQSTAPARAVRLRGAIRWPA
jgi:hypothetical protein